LDQAKSARLYAEMDSTGYLPHTIASAIEISRRRPAGLRRRTVTGNATRVSASGGPARVRLALPERGQADSAAVERRDASNGAPHTLGFQPCDAIRRIACGV